MPIRPSRRNPVWKLISEDISAWIRHQKPAFRGGGIDEDVELYEDLLSALAETRERIQRGLINHGIESSSPLFAGSQLDIEAWWLDQIERKLGDQQDDDGINEECRERHQA